MMRRTIKRPKYNNRKVEHDGIRFDSRKECRRYRQLKQLQAAGIIHDLQMQVPFVLAPRVKFLGAERAKPAIKYVADFVYVDADGNKIVEDAKGFKTDVYRLKKHLMKSVHNLDITEI